MEGEYKMAKKKEEKESNLKKNKVHKVKDLENISKKKKKTVFSYSTQELLIVVVVTCLISSVTTAAVLYFKNRSENAIAYHRLNDDEGLSNFVNLYADILKNYYEDVDKEGMINAATNSMLSFLGDDYTSYLNPNSFILTV